MDWDVYSFTIRTKLRRDMLTALQEPKTPTQIGKEVDSSVSHVSRNLKQFMEKGVARCLTPKLKMGRVYELTKLGKEILNQHQKSVGSKADA